MNIRFVVFLAAAWQALSAPCFADTDFLLPHIVPLAKLRTQAANGDPIAQAGLGLTYYRGDHDHGVTQDYAEAAKWYRKAAEQGNAPSQLMLGRLYFDGNGVTRNYVEAYLWYSLAAAQGLQAAKPPLDSLEKLMTKAQIAEAQKRAAAWHPSSTPAQMMR